MKKRTLKKVAIWAGITIVVVAGIGYFAINYTANKVLDALAESAFEAAASPSAQNQGDEANSTSTDQQEIPQVVDSSQTSEVDNSSSDSIVNANEGDAPTSSKLSSNLQTDVDNTPNKKSSDRDKHTTTPMANKNEAAEEKSTSSYSAEISVDKAEEVKKDISFSEKTKVMSVMLKRLSADDLKTLSSLASGGLSIEKKAEAKKIILQKLSEEEYNQLISIAEKYGLSQGKSYSDSQKEDLGSANP